MEKKVFGFPRVAIVLLAASLFLSCGFEPAWKSSDTTVSFRLGPAARAIAPGDGYLYIRPLGGPLGTGPKPYIGPIELSAGDSFTTTEIEPGSYDGFVLIYSPYIIDDVRYLDDVFLVRTVFSASDDDFNYGVFDSDITYTFFEDVLQNAGSWANTGPVHIAEGKLTDLHLTLVPRVSLSSVYDVGNNRVFSGDARYRFFLMVNGSSNLFGNGSGYVNYEIDTMTGGSFVVNSLAFFQSNGKSWPLHVTSLSTTQARFTDGILNEIDNIITPDPIYLYIDITVLNEDAVINVTRIGI